MGWGVMRRAISVAILLVAAIAAPAQESPRPRVQPQNAVVPPASDCSALVISLPRNVAVSRTSEPAKVETRLPEPAPRVDQRAETSPLPGTPAVAAPEAFERLAIEARNGTYEAFSAALDRSRTATASAPPASRDRYRSALDVYDDVNRIFSYSVEEKEGSFFNDNLLSGEYSRLVREYPNYREFIEPFALTLSGTTLYPTSETRRFLADEAARRVQQGGPVRSGSVEARPRVTPERATSGTPPATIVTPRPAPAKPVVVTTRPPGQRPATAAPKRDVPRKPAVIASTPRPRVPASVSGSVSGDRSRTTRRSSSRVRSKPPVVAVPEKPQSPTVESKPVAPVPTPETTTSPASGSATSVPSSSDTTSPAESAAEVNPVDPTTATETTSTASTSTSSTRFDRNVEDLLASETRQPRRRSSVLLLTIAAVALIVFMLFFFGMRQGSSDDEEMGSGSNVIKHDTVTPKKASIDKKVSSETADDQSWVDPETKQWIDEVNKGKKS